MGAWEGPGGGVTKQDPGAGRMEHPPGNPGALLCSQPQLPAFLLPTPQLTNPSGCPACPEPLAQMLWLAFHPHAPSPAFPQLTKSHPASHLFSALAGIGLASVWPVCFRSGTPHPAWTPHWLCTPNSWLGFPQHTLPSPLPGTCTQLSRGWAADQAINGHWPLMTR